MTAGTPTRRHRPRSHPDRTARTHPATRRALGTLQRVCGELSYAIADHQEALELAREIHSPWDEAHALAGLGRCAWADGRKAEAEVSLREAWEIFRHIGTHEITGIAVELAALSEDD